MERSTSYEEQRLEIQVAQDSAKTQAERNQMGQFATPTKLAADMLRYARQLLSQNISIRFLDPGFGTGSFFSALIRTFPLKRIEAAKGFEIDEHYGMPALKLWKDTPLNLTLEDFTRSEPPKKEEDRFNLIICNPPYVRHHHIVNGEKTRLQSDVEKVCGVRISGLAGLYCYFLILSHRWMTESGIAGWLIPSEFMDVNYGKAIKHYLLHHVTLLRIHRFDPGDVQFGDALVSSAVVWFRKEKPMPDHMVEFTYGGSLTEPKVSRNVAAADLGHESKWTRFPVSEVREASSGVTIGDFFAIKRGIATGANKFFILSPEQIARHRLPTEFFRPILPSPRFIRTAEILADDRGNPLLEQSLFLLDCRLPEEEVKKKYPPLWKYLQTGKPDVSERYLCRTRLPWYSQENRPPAPFVCTYMGRGDVKSGRPFRFLLNHSQATAANVYLLLYPKPILTLALSSNPDLARKIWTILNSISIKDILGEGRVYGGGLHKLEPKELANIPVEPIAELIPKVKDLFARQIDLFGK